MTTVSVNISGGGICLRIEEKIDIGRLVECVVDTDADRKISFIGKVVRCEKSEIESKYRYEAGIDYTRIEDKEREAVVRFIFEEQRKLRKKGLI
jgi:c-di-GMP-binding flagellar brake protein YcgR